jgi:hypothetical protein
MGYAEIETWSRWASPDVVAQAQQRAQQVRERYLRRGCAEDEALAAGHVTLELAVICHIAPQPLDVVLRPSLRWAG